MSTGALVVTSLMHFAQPAANPICVFAVLISALLGGYVAGWLALGITGVGLGFQISTPQSSFGSSFVLWCAYIGLGCLLVEVVRRLQRERRRLREHDLRAKDALRVSEKMAATGRVAATISHELRNPLDSVMQLLYLVKHSSHLDESEKRHLELADQELLRMAEVAQQTLAMHRQAPAMVSVNLAKLIDGVLLLYGKKIRAQKIQIDRRYEWQGEVPGLPADLRQVFTNLIVNGVEAMPSGGKLYIHVRRHRESIAAQRTGVLISLMDTGAGIPSPARKHMFEPFFSTKGEKGSGVGLWVSKGIVQRHNGTIHFRSSDRPGRSYTCFEVFLPENTPRIRAPEPESRHQNNPASPAPRESHAA